MNDTYHRLFICLMPDKNIRNQARDIRRKLAKFSYKFSFVNLEQIHLTLKFLGNKVSSHIADDIIEELNTTTLPQVNIRTETIEFGFPGQKKPNVLYLTTYANDALNTLVDEIQSMVRQYHPSEVITKKDNEKFFSHMTIARVKKDISRSQIKQIREIIDQIDFDPEQYLAKELYVIKSILTKKGPIYSVYDKIPLKV